jgi:anti-sigma B factor antagonist/stage II sporulation protein AA (anti-sigma F factor antagonist)
VFRVTGELDASSGDRLEDGVIAESGTGQAVVLDISDLTFLDTSGLRALFRLAARLEGDLVLRNPRSSIRRALWMSGITDRANLGLRLESGERHRMSGEGSDFLRALPLEPMEDEEPPGSRVRDL